MMGMKRTIIALLVLTALWAAFVLTCLMGLYGAAENPARDRAFDNAGKWYTRECAG